MYILSEPLLRLLLNSHQVLMSVSEIQIFLKRRSLSKDGWHYWNSEADPARENKEGFLHSTNVSCIPTTDRATCQGQEVAVRLRVAGAHEEVPLGWTEVSGSTEVNAHERTPNHPQTSARAAPQQINTTTAQAPDVHEVRRPSREIQKPCSCRIAQELTTASEQPNPRLCWTLLQILLASQMKLLFWKSKCAHFRKPLT